MLAEGQDIATRGFYFCAGCPYNSGTVVPEGSRAYAGIGCHYMVLRMDRQTEGYTQMGAEGANWVGEAPFSTRGHVFQNIGDGTYNHSGSLALRAAAISGVNITYRIYVNDAVALTGGQKVDGGMTVDQIAAAGASPRARGRSSSSPRSRSAIRRPHRGRPAPASTTATGSTRCRRSWPTVEGLSVLIYDQTCAAEKRRRRKRGTYPDPDRTGGHQRAGLRGLRRLRRPVELRRAGRRSRRAFGRKRAIDQSSCNKDISCLKGFCPSFVTVHGARRA